MDRVDPTFDGRLLRDLEDYRSKRLAAFIKAFRHTYVGRPTEQ